jgi:NADH:ubiquinone reductase (non-electrogenic)
MLSGAAGFYFLTQRHRTPRAQMPFDSDKKTVVLGSDEPPLGAGHGGIQCCTFHLIFLILENSFSPYPQVIISPRNYFLFTPLLPSVTIGILHPRSIFQPTQYITEHKSRNVSVIEAEATDVDVSVERPFMEGVGTDALLPYSQQTRRSLSRYVSTPLMLLTPP